MVNNLAMTKIVLTSLMFSNVFTHNNKSVLIGAIGSWEIENMSVELAESIQIKITQGL